MADPRVPVPWVALSLALLLALAMAWPASPAPRGEEMVHPGSTYMSSRDGAKALFVVLQRLGFAVERSTRPVGNFEKARLAFVIAPEPPLDERAIDAAGLADWVEQGGTLVYAASFADLAGSPVAKVFGFKPLPTFGFEEETRRLPLAPAYGPARELSVRGESRIVPARGQDPLERVTEGADAVVSRSFGAGRIIVLAGPSAAENMLLGEADNAAFFALLAERYGGGLPIVFSESVHGMGTAEKLLPIAEGPAHAALLLLAAAGLFYAVGAGTRLSAPSPEPAPARRSTIEQVQALARLYERTSSRRLALERLGITVSSPVTSDAAMVRWATEGGKARKEGQRTRDGA